jgi:hypothetical protein
VKEIKVKCLGCGSLEGGDFCGGCHTVLPIEGPDLDFFRLFHLEPRPGLDAAALKATFIDLSQKLHPDHNMDVDETIGARVLSLSAQLNQGYKTLNSTKERLRYLVGRLTETEPQEAKQVPAEIMELFFEVHDLMEEIDAHLKVKKAPGSRIVAAAQSSDVGLTDLLERIAAMRARERQAVKVVEDEVAELDGRWDAESVRGPLLHRLTELADVLSYLGRLKTSLDGKELALRI